MSRADTKRHDRMREKTTEDERGILAILLLSVFRAKSHIFCIIFGSYFL